MTTFEALVDRASARGRTRTDAPLSRAEIARRCGIRRQHLYYLMAGQREARPYIIARLAKGLALSENTVKRALRETRRQAELLS